MISDDGELLDAILVDRPIKYKMIEGAEEQMWYLFKF